SSRLKPETSQPSRQPSRQPRSQPSRSPSSYLPKTSHSYPQSNREKRGGNYEPSFGQSRSRSQAPQGGNFSKDGRLIPYVPLLYPSTAGYSEQNPLSSRRSTSFPTVNLHEGPHGLPLAYVPVS
ncbi:hypothetical protein Avbf_01700, partial [Armadillidium vulgare]